MPIGRWVAVLASAALLAGCAWPVPNTVPSEAPTATPVSAPEYPLTVTVAGPGSVAGATLACADAACSGSFAAGATVSLTATPGAGAVFTGWTGACSGTGACVVSMTAAASVGATFSQATQALAVVKSGPGLITSAPAGIACGEVCAFSFGSGTSVVLTAVADPGATFTGWTGDCTGAEACTISLDAARNVGARFTRDVHELTVTTSGPGLVSGSPAGILCGAACTSSFEAGAAVTLNAVASPGSTFVAWGGDCGGSSPQCTLAMTGARSVTARFAGTGTPSAGHALTVVRTGASGTVTSAPGGISCGATCAAEFAAGTTVTLSAAPGTGAVFAGWGGDCDGAVPACTLGMSSARAVTARFLLNAYAVSVTSAGPGAVTSSPGGITCGTSCAAVFATGSAVTLTATPEPGAMFIGWTGACTGSSPSCTLIIDGPASLGASFIRLSYAVTVARSGPGQVVSTPAGIDCGAVCSASFPAASTVTLTAIPDSNGVFTSWSGGCAGTSASCTLTVDAAKNVTALFGVRAYTLTVNVTGAGTVSSAPSGISCSKSCSASFAPGTRVVLTAAPAGANGRFTGWADAICKGFGTSPCVLILTADVTVTAVFVP